MSDALPDTPRDNDPTSVWRYFINEDAYPDLDADAAASHLGQAIRCRTVSHVDMARTDYAEFARLRDLIRGCYPLIGEYGSFEVIGASVLITIEGTDPDLPAVILMGHQDVVPVVAGTEADWTHGAFSGHVDDTFIWGRGAIDMKSMLIGELEAMEYSLAHGGRPTRTVYLAFGEDEECLQTGSRAIAALLAARRARIEFLLDEGHYTVRDGAPLGCPGLRYVGVELAEKGYCDVRITARSMGGHSSNPWGGTSLEHVARAIARITQAPFAPEVPPLVRTTLTVLGPRMTDRAMAAMVGQGDWAGVASALAGARATFPLVTTTIAPTMVQGGSDGSNVMPQDMRAVINFRLLPGMTSAGVLGRCRELVADLPVELDLYQTPSEPSDSACGCASDLAWEVSSDTVGFFLADPDEGSRALMIVPELACGGTDAHMYEGICASCLRLGPMLVTDAECGRGVHGTDERITRRAFTHGIRMLIRIIGLGCYDPA